MSPEHWERVREIYEAGIATGLATFQTSAPSWEEWNRSHLEHTRLVYMDGSSVLGWAALTPVSGRCVYAGVGEVSVYIAPEARGRGLGKKLLEAMILESERNGLSTLQSGIFPGNEASVRLHLSCGFRIVGKRERIGRLHGTWMDTLLLERRSQKIGNP